MWNGQHQHQHWWFISIGYHWFISCGQPSPYPCLNVVMSSYSQQYLNPSCRPIYWNDNSLICYKDFPAEIRALKCHFSSSRRRSNLLRVGKRFSGSICCNAGKPWVMWKCLIFKAILIRRLLAMSGRECVYLLVCNGDVITPSQTHTRPRLAYPLYYWVTTESAQLETP